MKTISILGSTGSIGQSTLGIIRKHPDKFKVIALSAGNNIEQLVKDAKEFKPQIVSCSEEQNHNYLKEQLADLNIEIIAHPNGATIVAQQYADLFISAIVGIAGLVPTLEAIKSGTTVALANKESIVCAGNIFINYAKSHNTTILPLDSEHNAIFQVLESHNYQNINKVILTCSGGPFRQTNIQDLKEVTKQQALKHPNWSMGAKITIDSATLMNKALEWIEAIYLFNLQPQQLEIVIHPQSIIHSMVSYSDGSVLAQMGTPDMAIPISYALNYPQRTTNQASHLDLLSLQPLTFEPPDYQRFPAPKLAMHAFNDGLSAQIALNGANEIAIEQFLNEKIKFIDIVSINSYILEQTPITKINSVPEILEFDSYIRTQTYDYINKSI